MQYDAAMADVMKPATATQRPTGLREMLWQPADLCPPDVLSGMTKSSTGAMYEVGVTKSWPQQDFPALAPRVRVPLQFSVAEHERCGDQIRDAGPDTRHVHRIAAIRNQSAIQSWTQSVLVGQRRGLPQHVLSFVEECIVAHRDASEAMEAG